MADLYLFSFVISALPLVGQIRCHRCEVFLEFILCLFYLN